MGSGDSRLILEHRSAYGQNTDCRAAGYIYPGPFVSTLTLTSSADNPTKFFEALGYLWVIAGRRLYRIDITTQAVTLSLTLSAGQSFKDGIEWENNAVVTTTESASGDMRRLTSGGIVVGGPDSWSAAVTQKAWLLARGPKELYSVNRTGAVSKLASGLTVDSLSWSAVVQVGEADEEPTGLVAWLDQVFVGKPEGFYGFDDRGLPVNIIPELGFSKSSANCAGMAVWHNSILIPHVRGLMRYYHPRFDHVGVERHPVNETPAVGQWRGFAQLGQDVFAAVDAVTVAYIKIGRPKVPGESGFGPIIWDDLIYDDAVCKAVHVVARGTGSNLYFGSALNVKTAAFAGAFGSADHRSSLVATNTSAGAFRTRYMPKIVPHRGLDNHWRKVVVVTGNCDSLRTWKVYASIDGEDRVQLRDATGQPATIMSNGAHTLYFPPNTVGEDCELSVDWSNTDSIFRPRIEYIRTHWLPIPVSFPGIRVLLELRQNNRAAGMAMNRDDAVSQALKLQLMVDNGVVRCEDIYQRKYDVKVRSVEITEGGIETAGKDPTLLAEVVLQRVEAVEVAA